MVGKLGRGDRLTGVAHGAVRVRVGLDDQSVRAGGESGEGHARDQ